MKTDQETIQDLSDALASKANQTINFVAEKVVGQDAVILNGKYEGRRAQVTGVTFYMWTNNKTGLMFLVQPYKKNRKGEYTDELLWDDPQARTYRFLSEFKLIEE